jgi:hypothetical protein
MPTDASTIVPELPQAPTVPYAQDRTPQFDPPMQDMSFTAAWDPHIMHPDQMQSFFGFSETELMPAFMGFTDQTTSWYNL